MFSIHLLIISLSKVIITKLSFSLCLSLQIFHKRMPPEAVDLVSRLLQYSPNLRCNAVSKCNAQEIWPEWHIFDCLFWHILLASVTELLCQVALGIRTSTWELLGKTRIWWGACWCPLIKQEYHSSYSIYGILMS